MRLICARAACIVLALAVAAVWTARGGSDVLAMWLMAPYLLAAAGRGLPTIAAAVLPAATGAVLGPRGLASGGGTAIDGPLLASTAAALACAALVLTVEALNRRPEDTMAGAGAPSAHTPSA